jgi:ribosomal-protein-alanine N-acetyltransferase
MSALIHQVLPKSVPLTGVPARMSTDDLAEVVALERRVYSFPWTQGNFADSLAAGHVAFTLRDESGSLLAYAVLMRVMEETHLLNLAVDQPAQGRGLGRCLLNWLMAHEAHYGQRSMLLEVRPSNVPAIKLYGSVGFVEIGRRKGYYPAAQGREDALVMRHVLDPQARESIR